MPDSKITALTSISTSTDPANDPLVIVDLSDTSMAATGTTKKVTLNQLLGASGTATLASATISGDLTVDTNVLKVDTANNRVGIGTATPAVDLHIQAAGSASAEVRLASATRSYNIASTGSGYGSANNLIIYDLTGAAERYRLDSSGNHFWNNVGGVAGTAMTLNATGLGVGASPANDKLLSLGSMGILLSGATSDFSFRNSGGTAIQRLRYTDATGALTIGSATGTAYPVELGGNTTTRAVTIDASSNVGIGVTPSAWNASFRGIDISTGGAIAGSSDSVRLFSNSAFNTAGNNVYKNAATAGRYDIQGNVHTWNISTNTPSAGGVITFSPAMTLDASGRLILLASTTTPATLATNGQLTFTATSNTNLRFSYRGSDGVTRTADLTLA